MIQGLLADEPGRWAIVRAELQEIRRAYGDARRTQLAKEQAAPVEYREEDYIIDEDAWIIVTRDGWVKRQKSFGTVASIKIREEDRVGWVYRSRARHTISFFTDRGAAYTFRVNDVPMTTGHGEPIGKHFAFEDGEHVVGVVCHEPALSGPRPNLFRPPRTQSRFRRCSAASWPASTVTAPRRACPRRRMRSP